MRDADIIETGLWNSLYKEQRDVFSTMRYRINLAAFNNSKYSSASLSAYFKSNQNGLSALVQNGQTNIQQILWAHLLQS